MISLGGLVSQKAFGKFEMGKVISNPFATAFIKEAEGEDHEVSMGQNQLDTIIKMATELKAKMGENEKEIPAWIQDHISKAENYISQAAGNYHEYGTNESINEGSLYSNQQLIQKLTPTIEKDVESLKKEFPNYDIELIKNRYESDGSYTLSISGKNTSTVDNNKLQKAIKSKIKESVNEAFEVHYSDGIRASKKFGNERQAVQFAKDLIKNKKSLQFVDVFNAGSGFNSTADTNAIVAWWGNGSYTANKAKSDSKLAKKKIDESINEIEYKDALEKFNLDLYKNSQVAAIAKHHNRPVKDVVKALQPYIKVLRYSDKSIKLISIDYRETNSNVKVHVSQTYKQNESSIKEASPCWKGYKQVGMKDKNGRQVPNCVPNESIVKEAGGRVPKIFVKTAAVEKKIKELMADRKKAVVPYNNETDPAKKEKLKQILLKLTNQIKGYEKNLIDLRDMEEKYIQQMQADVELDASAFDY